MTRDEPHLDMEALAAQMSLYGDTELPGMWETADLIGGEADSTNEFPYPGRRIGTELHQFVERYNDAVASEEIFCPFAKDFICPGGCPSMQERACINGMDDD